MEAKQLSDFYLICDKSIILLIPTFTKSTIAENILSFKTKSMSYLMKFSLSIHVNMWAYIEHATCRRIMIRCALFKSLTQENTLDTLNIVISHIKKFLETSEEKSSQKKRWKPRNFERIIWAWKSWVELFQVSSTIASALHFVWSWFDVR